jgi:beta-mannanase
VVTDTAAELATFDADAGKRATLSGSYDSFAYDSDFDSASASALVAQGVQPMVTWEPWDPGVGTATQPTFALADIISGNFDSYVTRWATEIKDWGQPLWLRFAHEMNGDWYPWSAGVNGNTAAQYVAAWRHVHDIFEQVGTTNVTWVWTPNIIMGATPTLASLYPGDAYVDVIGMDGYNWGTSQSWGSTWQTPSQLFGPTLSALEQISSRPIMIGETASTEIGGNKATWINQFFSFLAAQPRITAFVWFNVNKETDWRIESSAAAQSAFAAGVANHRYS